LQTLIKAGRNATIIKSDIKDAYKLIPNPISQRRLYGFSWLGKMFSDSTTAFGSAAAPASFDPLPETTVNIVCTKAKIPRKWVKRKLDDVPVVAPQGSNLAESFYDNYKEVCGNLRIPLPPNCPNHDKAFGPSTSGTVLGIKFDSEKMEWSLSRDKANGIVSVIDVFLAKKTCNLQEIQKLHGKLSDLAQACGFLKGFRSNVVSLLSKFKEGYPGGKLIPASVKKDLNVWKNFAHEASKGFPLGDLFDLPLSTGSRL
jgi:hypothetical protein